MNPLDRIFDVLDDDDRCQLTTERFSLTPMGQDDLTDIFAHFGDPKVTEFLDIRTLDARSDAREVVDWAEGLRASGHGVRWVVRDRQGGFVGTCGFHNLNVIRGQRAEIGYDLATAWWRKGVMAEVMPAALGFAYEGLGLHRIEAMVTPGNDRSCAVLERHGFQREGTLRGYGHWRDEFWDQILYARLATDR